MGWGRECLLFPLSMTAKARQRPPKCIARYPCLFRRPVFLGQRSAAAITGPAKPVKANPIASQSASAASLSPFIRVAEKGQATEANGRIRTDGLLFTKSNL